MGILGTLIGGAIGWSLGGPLGAMLGASLGSSIGGGSRSRRGGEWTGTRRHAPPPPPPPGGRWAGTRARRGPMPNPVEERRVAFFVATFGVMGHIAKADGQVSEEEARLAREIMRGLELDREDRQLAVRLFNAGKAPDFDLDAALGQLRRMCGQRRNLLRNFVEIQFRAAWADGSMHPAERRILNHVGAFLGFSPREMAQMERVACAGLQPERPGPEEQLREAYGVLGIERSASDAELRKAYRRLMRQHHPDRLAAQGLPEEMKAEATRRSQQITSAYQTVRNARKAA